MGSSTRYRGKGNILLVEREAELRAFINRVLTEAGYVVFECADGYQAFLLSEALTQPLHLLLAEVDLGIEPGGVELSRHLQVLRPGLRVLFLSAVPTNPGLRRELQAMLDSYLSKPFSSLDLLGKVDILMEKSRANPGRKDGMDRRAVPVTVKPSAQRPTVPADERPVRQDWRPAARSPV